MHVKCHGGPNGGVGKAQILALANQPLAIVFHGRHKSEDARRKVALVKVPSDV